MTRLPPSPEWPRAAMPGPDRDPQGPKPPFPAAAPPAEPGHNRPGWDNLG